MSTRTVINYCWKFSAINRMRLSYGSAMLKSPVWNGTISIQKYVLCFNMKQKQLEKSKIHFTITCLQMYEFSSWGVSKVTIYDNVDRYDQLDVMITMRNDGNKSVDCLY